MKYFFLFLLVYAFSFTCYANIDERKTDIYFANGILTSPSQAEYNTFTVLQSSVMDLYVNEREYRKHVGKVWYAYNQTKKYGSGDESPLLCYTKTTQSKRVA